MFISPAHSLPRCLFFALLACVGVSEPVSLIAQQAPSLADQPLRDRVDALLKDAEETREQLEQTRQQMKSMQEELAALKARFNSGEGTEASIAAGADSARLQGAVAEIREQQEFEQSEITQHEQTKIETESKFPLKVTGLVLFNAFSNKGAVDSVDLPVVAESQYYQSTAGSTGASLRQTILGFDASGGHFLGGKAHGDARVDFFGGLAGSYYGGNSGTLRLRTAHAALDWANTEFTLMLDRPILSPLSPTSLMSVGEPPLAWSGNLWTWNPQIEASHHLRSPAGDVELQGALIDVADAVSSSGSPLARPPSAAERSRYPGIEARIGYSSHAEPAGSSIGIGGYFSPHQPASTDGFQAWAGTMDWRVRFPARLDLTGQFYRGQALGGLGGGAFKDYVTLPDPDYSRALDAVGGWSQLSFRANERLQWNAAFGQDNVFAGQLRVAPPHGVYQALARNQTMFSNFIYTPTAFLLLSAEYRRIVSSELTGPAYIAHTFGLAAGYKF